MDDNLKNKLLEAVNEGVSKALIQIDKNDPIFNKSKENVNLQNHAYDKAIRDFKIGDYVCYNEKIGYNNLKEGEEVAICVNDELGKELYAVLNHPLLTEKYAFANEDTGLYKAATLDFKDGWKNTQSILKNYSTELEGTIWDHLGQDEYIPSKEELQIIWLNCRNTDLQDTIGFKETGYWSSSRNPDPKYFGDAMAVYFSIGLPMTTHKDLRFHSIVLLHIN